MQVYLYQFHNMLLYVNDRSFVMADIPGIIEGASEGKGLGLRFLRHIERNAVLLFMVPADSDDISKDYEVLLRSGMPWPVTAEMKTTGMSSGRVAAISSGGFGVRPRSLQLPRTHH